MSIPAFSWHHLQLWHFGLLADLVLVVASLAYLLGVARAPLWPLSRVMWFFGGIVTTFVATQSVIGAYDMSYFSVHMIEHLLLIMAAAPFFALSAPLDLAYAAGSPGLRRVLDSPVAAVLTHPLSAFAAYFIVIPLSHLTGLAGAMMVHSSIHHGEQIAFLIVGYFFFRVAFGRERGVHLHPGLRLVFIMAAVPVDTFTGLALVMSSHQPIAHYAAMAPTGSSAAWQLANVHLAGAIMWIGGDALMLAMCIPVVVTWVKWETVRTREIDAELDALGI